MPGKDKAYEPYNETFKDAAERAGVAGVRWHDLRHTFATWLKNSGASVDEIMVKGGWLTREIVDKRYAVGAVTGVNHLDDVTDLPLTTDQGDNVVPLRRKAQ